MSLSSVRTEPTAPPTAMLKTANGATKFDGSDFRGRYRVTDLEVIASNRVSGKDKMFKARLEAIQNGYLLILTDSDYEPLQYILFRRK